MFQILNAVGFFSLFYCFLFSPINLFFYICCKALVGFQPRGTPSNGFFMLRKLNLYITGLVLLNVSKHS
jgi:hypothetical protein